jgi:large subunit ribosomal protein L7/L12
MTEQLQVPGSGNEGGVAVATSSNFPDDIRSLGDTIASLKLAQVTSLRVYLRESYDIDAPESGLTPSLLPVVTEQIAEIPEVKLFDVVLKGFDPAKKMGVIKEFRSIMGTGLAESKAAVEGSEANPIKLKESLSKEEAEVLVKKMEELGAKIQLQ